MIYSLTKNCFEILNSDQEYHDTFQFWILKMTTQGRARLFCIEEVDYVRIYKQ